MIDDTPSGSPLLLPLPCLLSSPADGAFLSPADGAVALVAAADGLLLLAVAAVAGDGVAVLVSLSFAFGSLVLDCNRCFLPMVSFHACMRGGNDEAARNSYHYTCTIHHSSLSYDHYDNI